MDIEKITSLGNLSTGAVLIGTILGCFKIFKDLILKLFDRISEKDKLIAELQSESRKLSGEASVSQIRDEQIKKLIKELEIEKSKVKSLQRRIKRKVRKD